jgi:putative endonuclease
MTHETERAVSWIVYILQCADNSLYTGITNDLDRRMAEHAAGKGAKYTKSRGPFRLVYSETCQDRAEASRRETAIKAMDRGKKLLLFS